MYVYIEGSPFPLAPSLPSLLPHSLPLVVGLIMCNGLVEIITSICSGISVGLSFESTSSTHPAATKQSSLHLGPVQNAQSYFCVARQSLTFV